MFGQKTLSRFIASRLLYNTGRLITYSLLGILAGIIGEAFFISGFQQYVSVGLGIGLILVVTLITISHFESKLSYIANRFIGVIKFRLGSWLKNPSLFSSLFSGLMNGLLPCGLVYLGIAGSLATTDFWDGTIYMVVFGLGTFPAMFILAMTGKFTLPLFTNVLGKSRNVIIGIIGLLLIIRGLNLDIPYLSPTIDYIYPMKSDISICN